MGYYTNYQLEWDGTESVNSLCPHCNGLGQITTKDAVAQFVQTEPFLYNNVEPIQSSLDDSCKWYDHEDDMKRLSKKFPNTLFTLRGEGEEAGDVWVKYFKAGKMQVEKAEIKLAAFDPSRMS